MTDLTHLKPGDMIAVRQSINQGPMVPFVQHKLLTVERVTATQIVAGGRKFRRTNGNEFDTGNAQAILVTPEILETHKQESDALHHHNKALARFHDVKEAVRMSYLSASQMEAIADAYEATLQIDSPGAENFDAAATRLRAAGYTVMAPDESVQIVIDLDGGLISDVTASAPLNYLVYDHDIEGCSGDEIAVRPAMHGGTTKVFSSGWHPAVVDAKAVAAAFKACKEEE